MTRKRIRKFLAFVTVAGQLLMPAACLAQESDVGEKLVSDWVVLGNAVARLASAAQNGYEDLRIGPCTRRDTEISCRSSIQIPGASDTTIRKEENGRATVDAYLFRGNDKARASEYFERYAALLTQAFPHTAHRQDYDGFPTMTFWPARDVQLALHFYEHKRSLRYNEDINLFRYRYSVSITMETD